jgi:hypothetical protein
VSASRSRAGARKQTKPIGKIDVFKPRCLSSQRRDAPKLAQTKRAVEDMLERVRPSTIK